MARPWGRTLAAGTAGCAMAAVLAGLPARSQQQPEGGGDPGPRFELSLGSELRAGTNPDLSADDDAGTLLRTGVRLALRNVTRDQVLSFSLSAADLRATGGFGEDRVLGPDLAFAYDRTGARARLAVTLDSRVRDFTIDPVEAVPLPEGPDPDEVGPDDVDVDADGLDDEDDLITEGGGRVRESDLTFALVTGIDRPLGFTFTAALRRDDYEDVVDPDLLDDVEERALSAALRLELAPSLTGRLRLGTSRREEGEETTERRSASVGLSYAISPVLEATAAIGAAEVERDDGTDASSETLEIGLARLLPRGSVALAFDRRLDGDETVDRLRLSGARDLGPTDALTWALGYARADDGEDSVVGDLSLRRALPRGSLALSLSRTLDFDIDDGTRIGTAAGLRLTRQINASAALSLGGDYRSVEEEDGTEEALSLGATLSYQLDRAWLLEGGIEHERRTDPDRSDTTLFIGLSRSFAGLL